MCCGSTRHSNRPSGDFDFLKDPLFFTSSVFVKSRERVAASTFVMGLCLLIYNLGQRALRQALLKAGESLPNQIGKPTHCPTLHWVFQCFQAVHLLQVAGVQQVSNLTPERRRILSFLGAAYRQYYLPRSAQPPNLEVKIIDCGS